MHPSDEMKDSKRSILEMGTGLIATIAASNYQKKWSEFLKTRCAAKTPFKTYEFLLKYRYDTNWYRECEEQYLWYWEKDLDWFFNDKYKVSFENDFYIPFIMDQIKADFGVSLKVNTHKKVLYVLTNS